ncbi:MAG: hypothetical protein ACON4Z_13475 [Planctomycetota bacterium]
MHLESHATPIGESPQQRYASLHRAIERGLASDELWSELASVCEALGNRGEALHCLHRIRDDALRTRAERAVLGGPRAGDGRHTGAPAASIAGRRERARAVQRPRERPPCVRDHLVDAAQFLSHGQMPALTLAAMLAFPLVIGVAGLFAGDAPPLLLAGVAALPGLCVLAVVAGMAREVLLLGCEGEGDAPGLPDPGQLIAGALRFTTDLGVVGALCLGPAAAALALGAPGGVAAATVALGALVGPLTFALRQVRGDWRPCSPGFVASALRRAGPGYPLVALAVTLAFAPALGVLALASDRPVWIQIACVGPLLVLPLFASARLLGTWLDSHRATLGGLLEVPAAPPTTATQARAPRDAGDLRRAAAPRRRALSRSR